MGLREERVRTADSGTEGGRSQNCRQWDWGRKESELLIVGLREEGVRTADSGTEGGRSQNCRQWG